MAFATHRCEEWTLMPRRLFIITFPLQFLVYETWRESIKWRKTLDSEMKRFLSFQIIRVHLWKSRKSMTKLFHCADNTRAKVDPHLSLADIKRRKRSSPKSILRHVSNHFMMNEHPCSSFHRLRLFFYYRHDSYTYHADMMIFSPQTRHSNKKKNSPDCR